MTPEENISRLKAREYAIETLIDMHPNGAAYRSEKFINETLKSNLESRYNRIPDWALLDHATSLSQYEILPDSKEVLGDLLWSHDNDDDEVVPTTTNDSNDKTKDLKEGWEDRLLRHHEKIIRAKNNIGSNNGTGTPRESMATPSSKDGSIHHESPPSSSNTKIAIPPPRLISVLRQIFDSPSSSDLKGLLSSDGNKGDKIDSSQQQQQQQVNVLPSLLHSIVNHPAFSSGSHGAISGINRQLDTLFNTPREGGGKTSSSFEDEAESNPNSNGGYSEKVEIPSPSAANLEAIIGNVCRDLRTSRNGTDNSDLHGLLIASLSLLTASLSEEDDLDSFLLPSAGGQTSFEGGGTVLSNQSPESTWNATSDPSLQVGGLLTLLDTTCSKNGDVAKKYLGDKFLLDKSLSRYFAEASSIYEERIEIQKALLRTGTPTRGVDHNDDNDEFHTPKDFKKRNSLDSMGIETPPPPLSNRISVDNEEDSDEVIDADDEVVPGLSRPNRDSTDNLSNEDMANVTRMLLSNIANIVGGDVMNFDDLDMEGDEEGDAGLEGGDRGSDEEEEEEEEEHDDSDGDEDSNATREYNGREIASAYREANDGQEEASASTNNNDNNNEDERAMLQRALALSLAATASAGGSDSSNSVNTEDDRKMSAAKPPSERNRNLKSEELKRKSSGGSVSTGIASEDDLPSLPAPPSMDVLPCSSLDDDLLESNAAAVLDPAALSSFGNVPASRVLVQFLQTLLGILENHVNDSADMKELAAAPKPQPSSKPPLVSSMKKSTRKLKEDNAPVEDSKQWRKEFVPDSVTAQLLVASLHLSSYLRSVSISALNDILSEQESDVKSLAEEGERKDETIQIADSAESEDPLEEDPVMLVVAAQTALENKGFERKSAAAADITALRHTTKQKMVKILTERASFYSICSYLSMRSLRLLVAKCHQHGLTFSDIVGSVYGDIICMSTKSRSGISAILSGFHSTSVPATIQTLQDALEALNETDIDQRKELFEELLVSSLCNESLLLWGALNPFIHPEHKTRVELLQDLVRTRLSLPSTEPLNGSNMKTLIASKAWNSTELLNVQLDILCHRYRMSDILDYFLPQPTVMSDNSAGSLEVDCDSFSASLSTISLLGELLPSTNQTLPNVSQLYFAICGRSISSHILWNDLALSPTDGIGQDGSLKMELNPSKFHFDPSKCADSIAIELPRATANQRAAKVWGTVLSATHFQPKTGIHRFAVKLDRCERGHIFVGVATARANTKTYVGGDKNGWGFIGTQALWHDRNKIRGDYGSVLRTGAVVVATLDTDLGTLSFGLWKDGTDLEGGPMSPSLTSLSSPRRGSGIGTGSGAMIEDWGVAFEGLPLDAKLYPAVGLYQRDDRATLYTISSTSPSTGKPMISSADSSGHFYFPSTQELNPDSALQIRSWNQAVCSNGIAFAIDILMTAIELLSSGKSQESNVSLSYILPRLASALCLIPSCIPTLSAMYAMELLPFVTKCAKLFQNVILPESRQSSFNVEMKEGSWMIQISQPSTSDSESRGGSDEYTVDLLKMQKYDDGVDACFNGKGKGPTRSTSTEHVSLTAAVRGTRLQIIEEWSNEQGSNVSQSLIDARLSVDGSKFEGSYFNLIKNTTGTITGVLQTSSIYAAAKDIVCIESSSSPSTVTESQEHLVRTESILCLAAGHLSAILCSPTVMSDVDRIGEMSDDQRDSNKLSQQSYFHLLDSSKILSAGKLNDGHCIRRSVDSVWERCKVLEIKDYKGGSDIVEQWQDLMYLDLFTATDAPPTDTSTKRTEIESKLQLKAEEFLNGSFSRLCPERYSASMKNIVIAILYHCGINGFDSYLDCMKHAINTSRGIMESGIRDALYRAQTTGKSRSEICEQYCLFIDSLSNFLLRYPCSKHDGGPEDVLDDFSSIFNKIRSDEDLNMLNRLVMRRTEKSILCYVGIRAMDYLFRDIDHCPAAESVICSVSNIQSLSTSTLAGCASSAQQCVQSTIQSVYDKAESMAASINSADDVVTLSSLLLTLLTSVGYRHSVLKLCKKVLSLCRELAFHDIEEMSVTAYFRVNSAHRAIEAVLAAVHMQFTSATSQQDTYVDNREFLLELIVEELKQIAPVVERDYKDITDNAKLEGIHFDLNIFEGLGHHSDVAPKGCASATTIILRSSPLMSNKTSISASHGYFGQLLDLLHSFMHNVEATSSIVLDCLLDALKNPIPPSSCIRILRLMRPILLSVEASSDIVEQLFEIAGVFSNHVDSIYNSSNEMMKSEDSLRVCEAAVALLRILYLSSSWQRTIHEVIIMSYSFSSVSGVVAFIGGLFGSLQPGSFLIIEPDVALSLSSSTSLVAGKTRSALGGNTSTLNNSAGKGVEGIISGLCRQSALAGILCSVESKSGMCEVMVLPNRLSLLDNSTPQEPKVTVRAVRVSSAEIASASELPLRVNEDLLMTNIVGLLLEHLNLSSSLAQKCLQEESTPETLPSLQSLFRSAMSIRALTVLLSDPTVLQQTTHNHVHNFLALALKIASNIGAGSIDGLSKLPSYEAQLWHLLSVKSTIQSKRTKLENAPVSELEEKFDRERRAKKEKSKTRSSSAISGYRTPPPSSLASSFFGFSSARAGGRTSSTSTGVREETTDRVQDEEDEESESAANLREAAIVQMAELGLPRQWAEVALRRTGGDIEAAVHFCLERGGDMERIIAEEANRGSSLSSSRRRVNARMNSSHLISQLVDMGFPRHWCVSALSATSNNVDEALTWILTNGDRLAAEVEEEDEKDEDSEEEADDWHHEQDDSDEVSVVDGTNDVDDSSPCETEEAQIDTLKPTSGWHGSICPVRFVSGKSVINPQTLEISGLKDGGFSSVGTKGVLLTSGKWYYEANIVTAGCLQIGWADSSFAGHCQADRGDGCGDGVSSWAFDGWRRYKWHSNATEWGVRWSEGDVIGCLVDMDNMQMSFTLNGKGEEIGMGLAFSGEGFRPCSGVYCCVSFNSREKLRLVLGGEGTEPFRFKPEGYRGVGEAILAAVQERQVLLNEEMAVQLPNETMTNEEQKPSYICDFSDGEHGHELFSWQHRYYGSDASVHLGASRSLRGALASSSKKSLKSSGGLSKFSSPVHADVRLRLTKIFEKSSQLSDSDRDDEKKMESNINRLKDAYTKILSDLENELKVVHVALNQLYAQKLVLHLLIAYSSNFKTSIFHTECNPSKSEEDSISRQLFRVIEQTTSISAWLGEAGAMAVAAEALGLGISTYESNPDSQPAGMCTISEQVIVAGGISQFLSSAILSNEYSSNVNIITGKDTPWTFVAAAEAAIGSNSGGALTFLRLGLQNAVVTSQSFRQTLLAGVRRAIRTLTVCEFSTEDGASEDDDTSVISSSRRTRESDSNNDSTKYSPDARLVSFMTGVLLSGTVHKQLSEVENRAIMCSLFEGWCVGLLSASAPWRMICATTAAGILNICPTALCNVISRVPLIANYFGRLESTTSRRMWAERAAVPICSKYCQALIELLNSVKRASRLNADLPSAFVPNKIWVDAATPLPFYQNSFSKNKSWEWGDGWVSCDEGWETWTGTVEIFAVEWKQPQRSIVRTLMDGGEGPPFLNVGSIVIRGQDWGSRGDANNDDDGQNVYEKDKLAKELEAEEEAAAEQLESEEKNPAMDVGADPAMDDEATETPSNSVANNPAQGSEKKPVKKKKPIKTKLPVGTVIGIEPWNGMPAMARRVRWHLTGKEGVYRYGGDGGCFDIAHVEVNDKETRIKKRHPLPESLEQIASRYGFGQRRTCNVILRLNRPTKSHPDMSDIHCDGILEWPDFGAGIQVECTMFSDGAISITEKKLLYGSKDSGWEARFGNPSYTPGTSTVMSPIHDKDSLNQHETLLGSSSFLVKNLRNREDNGGRLRVTSEMRLFRAKHIEPRIEGHMLENESVLVNRSASQLKPICFDSDFHASSLSLSKDQRTVTCSSSEGRGTAFGNVGFCTGVHYWEVKIEKAEIGSVFIGVAEKPGTPSGSSQGGSFGFESKPRLNRWLGWGFVNFRATYTAGAERVYGSHCHSGDTVGVMLDCDSGRISYFYDGLKYGEHILNDLGCAFENISPFGFSADGCGSGGAGQGAPSGLDGVRSSRYPSNGAVRPRALWPVIGLRHAGDRVTMSSKWMTSKGVDGVTMQDNVLSVDEILCTYNDEHLKQTTPSSSLSRMLSFPQWFVEESFLEYKRWQSSRWLRTSTRGSGPCKLSSNGLDVDLDTTPVACAAACANIGLPIALLPGDKVDVKRSAGRLLELQEEAVVLGAYQGQLWYRLVSQKSEGGSLMEGGGRAWFWDESDAVEGGLKLIGEGRGRSIELPKIKRFKPSGGLKIVYVGGAVVRSDLEIFDGSSNIGTLPHGTVIPESNVVERRLNSCGVVRFLIDHEPVGRGWISGRIRGGKEEPIVEIVPYDDNEAQEQVPEVSICNSPEESAKLWYEAYIESMERDSNFDLQSKKNDFKDSFNITTVDEFGKLLEAGYIRGMNPIESDSYIASTYGKISDVLPHADEVDCPFVDCAIVLASAVSGSHSGEINELRSSVDSVPHEVALESLMHIRRENLPPLAAILTRIAMLRAFNRRARYALPWISLRPAQEGSAVFGGLSGLGSSLERAGRTWDVKSNEMWVQVPSTSTRLRACKNVLFPSIKRSLLESIMDTTATPTSLSHDEYELPREVRTVRVNRLKARQATASEDNTLKRKHSVFSQLQREMRGWSGATLRRGFVAKGHGGQKRAFKVKLVGEGVNDYSGPYREVFTDAMLEVTDVDNEGRSSLGVLEPTPNNEAELGEGRDLYMFAKHSGNSSTAITHDEYIMDQLSNEEKQMLNSFSTLTHSTTEQSREVEDAIVFLGKLAGTACRHGIPVDLPLPLGIVWDRLAEEPFTPMKSLHEIDLLAYNRTKKDEESRDVAVSNVNHTLSTQRRLLNFFAEGMSTVLPVELLTLFTGEQLRDILCGNPDIDVELLRRVVEYEGYTETDAVISYLWDVLREMTTSERKLFLQFVWARNRLPLKEADFDAPFRIQKDSKDVKEGEDYPLPSASTCFFSLMLPEYPSKDILKEKLLFAIENVTTMESDYVTNDVEVSEGWRGL